MSASFYDLLKYAATGIASPDMTYYDKMRASTLMGCAVQTLTGQPPLTFKADGTPLISWSMKGNGSQQGTPTPDNPVMPEFVGTLDDSDWTIPITCAEQTTPVYLGQTQTVRRVRKLVLTGEETIGSYQGIFYIQLPSDAKFESAAPICTHFLGTKETTLENYCIRQMVTGYWGGRMPALQLKDSSHSTQSNLKTYFSTQYENGTPVTVWYVLATPETGITNEPLAKIGTYADELSSADAGVAIPTMKGQNTLTVETELQPSEMTITYKG